MVKKVLRPNRKEIASYYSAHKADYYSPERVRLAQIVKNVDEARSRESAREQILSAQSRLKAGESFGAVAQECSDCPENAGELDWFVRGVMVDEFEEVAFSRAPGEISDIFETRFGFHIVRVLAREPEGIRPLREVSEQIAEFIYQRRVRASTEGTE